VTEQGRTNRAASAASGLSVRNKPVGVSRQWFSHLKSSRGLTLPLDADFTMVDPRLPLLSELNQQSR
jgi:hypothetical protein